MRERCKGTLHSHAVWQTRFTQWLNRTINHRDNFKGTDITLTGNVTIYRDLSV